MGYWKRPNSSDYTVHVCVCVRVLLTHAQESPISYPVIESYGVTERRANADCVTKQGEKEKKGDGAFSSSPHIVTNDKTQQR